jgi:hypothetical protein
MVGGADQHLQTRICEPPRLSRAAYARNLPHAHTCCPNTTHDCIAQIIRIMLAPLSGEAASVSFFVSVISLAPERARQLQFLYTTCCRTRCEMLHVLTASRRNLLFRENYQ